MDIELRHHSMSGRGGEWTVTPVEDAAGEWVRADVDPTQADDPHVDRLVALIEKSLANGGCSNCGGLPHTTTCRVGRLQRAFGDEVSRDGQWPASTIAERASQGRPLLHDVRDWRTTAEGDVLHWCVAGGARATSGDGRVYTCTVCLARLVAHEIASTQGIVLDAQNTDEHSG